MTLGTEQKQGQRQSMGRSSSSDAITPSQLKSVLLADGWHEISGNCEYTTQFAIAAANSPAQPNAVYAAISFTDKNSGKSVYVPVSKILAFETNDS